jgi:hypothetical protein
LLSIRAPRDWPRVAVVALIAVMNRVFPGGLKTA